MVKMVKQFGKHVHQRGRPSIALAVAEKRQLKMLERDWNSMSKLEVLK